MDCNLCGKPLSAAEQRLKATAHFACVVAEGYDDPDNFCGACQQHRPCSCDQMEQDTDKVAERWR